MEIDKKTNVAVGMKFKDMLKVFCAQNKVSIGNFVEEAVNEKIERMKKK